MGRIDWLEYSVKINGSILWLKFLFLCFMRFGNFLLNRITLSSDHFFLCVTSPYELYLCALGIMR